MSLLSACDSHVLCSHEDEAAFFACMGRFFASPVVRRECGGYPLNDGPQFLWFVARQRSDGRVLAFISVERQPVGLRIREGYVCPQSRGQGLFRQLCQRVLDHAQAIRMECSACVPEASVAFFMARGFRVMGRRGRWVTMLKATHE
jgi:GNAT superfamily N-acetyltransferase